MICLMMGSKQSFQMPSSAESNLSGREDSRTAQNWRSLPALETMWGASRGFRLANIFNLGLSETEGPVTAGTGAESADEEDALG